MRSALSFPTSDRLYELGQVLFVAAALLLLLTGFAPAQSHFNECTTQTGNNATIIIPASASVLFGSDPIEKGDEIAVFDAEGRCAGAVQWTGENVTLTVWGANEVTPEKDGLNPGEPMYFRLWSATDGQEWGGAESVQVAFANHQPYLTVENAYGANRIYVVDSLRFERAVQASRSPSQ